MEKSKGNREFFSENLTLVTEGLKTLLDMVLGIVLVHQNIMPWTILEDVYLHLVTFF